MSTRGPARSPLVTVLMPVHDGQAYLREAIDSILGQTLGDLELLIVDDGSTDETPAIIAGVDDPRVRTLRNERNLGLVPTLNRGLSAATGRYLARMDADDVSLPSRLERQVDFLQAHPEIGACGSRVLRIGDRQGSGWVQPTKDEDIRCRLLVESALAHPTACLRRELFEHHGLVFDESYPHAEDYELWLRAARHFPLANLEEMLLEHRIHEQSVSRRFARAQEVTVRRIHTKALSQLGIAASEEELRLHRWIAPSRPAGDAPPLAETERWLQKLLRANEGRERFPFDALERLVGFCWLRAGHRAVGPRAAPLARFLRSPLARHVERGKRLRLIARAAKLAFGGPRADPPAAAPGPTGG